MNFSGSVAQSSDDGAQSTTGTVTLTGANGVLSLLSNRSAYLAFRFEDVTIPPGATIESASLSLYAPNSSDVGMNGTIFGNLVANPGTLQSTSDYISGLAQTTNSVGWSATLTSGQFNQSPDISAIITELIGQSGWASGDAIIIILHAGSAADLAEIEMFDGSSSEAAQLNVSYASGVSPVVLMIAGEMASQGGFCNGPKNLY